MILRKHEPKGPIWLYCLQAQFEQQVQLEAPSGHLLLSEQSTEWQVSPQQVEVVIPHHEWTVLEKEPPCEVGWLAQIPLPQSQERVAELLSSSWQYSPMMIWVSLISRKMELLLGLSPLHRASLGNPPVA
jgi:hypothetical protein